MIHKVDVAALDGIEGLRDGPRSREVAQENSAHECAEMRGVRCQAREDKLSDRQRLERQPRAEQPSRGLPWVHRRDTETKTVYSRLRFEVPKLTLPI